MIIGIDLSTSMGYQGTEVFTDNLISTLAHLFPQDKFVIYGSQKVLPILSNHTLTNVRFSEPHSTRRIGRAIEQQFILPLKTYKDRIDVLFSPSPFSSLFARGRKVMTIHDAAYKRFPEFRSFTSRIYFSAVVFLVKYTARAVITVSPFSKKELETFYQIPTSSIHVIENSVPQSPKNNSTSPTRSLFEFGIRSPYVLFIGTPRPRKNLDTLLHAFALAQESHPELQLVIAGESDTRFHPALKIIQTLGIETSVIQTGFISNKEKGKILSQATTLIFPSLYEGFGLPVLEAQAAKTPVICSNTSTLPNTAGTGALLIDPTNAQQIAEAIQSILDKPSLRASLTYAGTKNIERFSWERSAKKLMYIFKSI